MPPNAPYIDIHTHRLAQESGSTAVVCIELDDIHRHAALPRFCSVGRHPWHAAAAWTTEDSMSLERVMAAEECIALGEVGLDRIRGPLIDRQFVLLEAQLDIALRHELPVVFHCVRAHADLMQLKKRRGDRQPWIIHGFSGHGELASQLLRMDFCLSFGAALLSSGAKAKEALTQVPLDRLFLETDDSGLDVCLIYRTASEVLGVSQDVLRKAIRANFHSVFGVEP